MISCPSCKTEIDDSSWYCDQCGQEIKYCASCNKIGKGNRCTACGDTMVPARLHSKSVNCTVLPQRDVSFVSIAANDKTVRINRPVKLYLVNYPLGLRIEAINEAVIGRRQGPYQSVFGAQPYISSKHAMLKHDPNNGWMIMDLDSSNGTFVDELQLKPNVPVAITKGTKVQLANVEMIVELE